MKRLAFGLTAAAAVITPLLVVAPAANADRGCLDAWDGADGAVYVSNSCLSVTIGASVDALGVDAPCTKVAGRFVNGRQQPQTWRFDTHGTAHAAHAYECWVW